MRRRSRPGAGVVFTLAVVACTAAAGLPPMAPDLVAAEATTTTAPLDDTAFPGLGPDVRHPEGLTTNDFVAIRDRAGCAAVDGC